MIKWMVQLLLRLSPDRPDHSIEARDSIHLGSATAAQIEESGHELFERLRFFTQNLFGCVLRRVLRHRVMNALVRLSAHSLQTLACCFLFCSNCKDIVDIEMQRRIALQEENADAQSKQLLLMKVSQEIKSTTHYRFSMSLFFSSTRVTNGSSPRSIFLASCREN